MYCIRKHYISHKWIQNTYSILQILFSAVKVQSFLKTLSKYVHSQNCRVWKWIIPIALWNSGWKNQYRPIRFAYLIRSMEIVWEVVDIQIQLGNCALWVERSFRKLRFRMSLSYGLRNHTEAHQKSQIQIILKWNGELWVEITSVFSRNLKPEIVIYG